MHIVIAVKDIGHKSEQVESGQKGFTGCKMDEGSLSCGDYQIKEGYYIDGKKHDKSNSIDKG